MNTAQDIYPSRVGKDEVLIDRQDPVVYGAAEVNSENALSKDQLNFFEQNGYLIFPDFVSPQKVHYLKNEIAYVKQQLKGREELVLEPESNELRSIFALHCFSEVISKFASSSRLIDPLKQIIGSDVYIMQSRLNIKPAYKGKSFPWHSDFETWHVEDGLPRIRTVTAWLMLSENNQYNGPLYVIPGSHKKFISCSGITGADNYKQSLRKQILGVPRPSKINEVIQGRGIAGIFGKPGTLVFHDANLLHGSPDNISPWSREILMFVYNSMNNKPVAPFGGVKTRPEYLSTKNPMPVLSKPDN